MIAMNLMFAAGLFDSPWVVAAIVIIGAFINWLSQLRQQKRQQEEERRARAGESEPPQKPSFDVEEALRRLLGEEAPKPTHAPPPLPHAAPPVWQDRPMVVPPVIVALPVEREFESAKVQQQTIAQMVQVAEQVRQHQVSGEQAHRVHARKWSGLWRDRASMRRAFVGSLVFGPPKGLES